MSDRTLDISTLLDWDADVPRPQWDVVAAWIASQCGADRQRGAWVDALRQWMAALAVAFGDAYASGESPHVLLLAPRRHDMCRLLPQFAESAQARLAALLGDLADLDAPGKQVMLVFGTAADYYRYIAAHYDDGEHATSAGIHIRHGYPHVAAHGASLTAIEATLTHELSHAAVHHLAIPQWLDEGLAQVLARDLTGGHLRIDREAAERHDAWWNAYGLEPFWRGEAFHSDGEARELAYQLAEILVRLLVEEARPRWFGRDRRRRERFRGFVLAAGAADCGAAACTEHLGYGLGDLAGRFLGPGEWAPAI
jgi:hypothetical protein